MSILNPWGRNDKQAIQKLETDIALLQAQQRAAELREQALTRLIENVAAQLKTIIDQNDKIVQALDASGLLNGHAG